MLTCFFVIFVNVRYPRWFYRRRITRQANPLRPLCTILVLCYFAITGISLELLHPVKIGQSLYLYEDGELKFFEKKDLFYVLVAMFFIVTIVIPVPVFLIFTPSCSKRLARRLGNLMPFYDPLQSCFKNQYRSFSAFYFVCRLAVQCIRIWIPDNLVNVKKAYFNTVNVLILSIFLYFQPYKESKPCEDENDFEDERRHQTRYAFFTSNNYSWLNTTDAVLLTILCVLSVFSSQIPYDKEEDVLHMWIIIYSLSTLPILLLLFVIVRTIYLRRTLGIPCIVYRAGMAGTPDQSPRQSIARVTSEPVLIATAKSQTYGSTDQTTSLSESSVFEMSFGE